MANYLQIDPKDDNRLLDSEIIKLSEAIGRSDEESISKYQKDLKIKVINCSEFTKERLHELYKMLVLTR